MKKVSIVGFGRFGPVLYRLLKDDFQVTIFTSKTKKQFTRHKFTSNTQITHNVKDIFKSDTIFYAVPIEAFEKVIKQHTSHFKSHHLLVDVLSVKLHPQAIFNKYLKDLQTQAMLTHPMFGPDSSKQGFQDLTIVVDKFKASDQKYKFWVKHFQKMGLKTLELSALKHDQLAASSQGLTHFISRLLVDADFKPTPIDTVGAKKLHQVVNLTCNDTWQLFTNLQNYNPYTKKMRLKLGKSYDKLFNKLLPARAKQGSLIIGIQGGVGSFNEEAVRTYIKSSALKQVNIEYLYTTPKVLDALHQGKIDLAQFAIHNSVGGVVQESIQSLAKHKVYIVKQFSIKISHSLMTSPDSNLSQIDTIMTHPQVLAQCKKNLQQKYPKFKITSGKGQLIDHALVAKQISQGKLPPSTATIGSQILAEIYGLNVVDTNLQDSSDNQTHFMIVSRTK